jgi:hypothetical protein
MDMLYDFYLANFFSVYVVGQRTLTIHYHLNKFRNNCTVFTKKRYGRDRYGRVNVVSVSQHDGNTQW